jgi:hypothetical protein
MDFSSAMAAVMLAFAMDPAPVADSVRHFRMTDEPLSVDASSGHLVALAMCV